MEAPNRIAYRREALVAISGHRQHEDRQTEPEDVDEPVGEDQGCEALQPEVQRPENQADEERGQDPRDHSLHTAESEGGVLETKEYCDDDHTADTPETRLEPGLEVAAVEGLLRQGDGGRHDEDRPQSVPEGRLDRGRTERWWALVDGQVCDVRGDDEGHEEDHEREQPPQHVLADGTCPQQPTERSAL